MLSIQPLYYIDRITRRMQQELVYGKRSLTLLYGPTLISRLLGRLLLPFLSRFTLFSYLYGLLQKTSWSKKKTRPFIQDFQIDTTEFLAPVEEFGCFNDFFTRYLKPESRPIAEDVATAIIPADGRYLIHPDVTDLERIVVKGRSFSLLQLLNSRSLAEQYHQGSMVVARLCPSDYHRYHFPVDCFAPPSTLINGMLYSVNPLALRYNVQILGQNKRMICQLETAHFGKVLYIEVGATNVGSIHQTYQSMQNHKKGAEKGFFSFGGSTIVLLFERHRIAFDADLLELSSHGLEIRCLLGQTLGKATVS